MLTSQQVRTLIGTHNFADASAPPEKKTLLPTKSLFAASQISHCSK
jgi:hypothetical protein